MRAVQASRPQIPARGDFTISVGLRVDKPKFLSCSGEQSVSHLLAERDYLSRREQSEMSKVRLPRV